MTAPRDAALQETGGGAVLIRRLQRHERPLFRDHLLRLDREARRLRFGHGVSDTFIVDYALREGPPGTVIEGAFVDGTLRAVAELRPLGPSRPDHAEAAFSVERPFRRRGIGSRLMERIVLLAQNHAIAVVCVQCLRENIAMRRLARRSGGDLTFVPGEVEGIIRAPAPTLFSLAREALAESVPAVERAAERTLAFWGLSPAARGPA